jgi:hypothetical protein
LFWNNSINTSIPSVILPLKILHRRDSNHYISIFHPPTKLQETSFLSIQSSKTPRLSNTFPIYNMNLSNPYQTPMQVQHSIV